MSYDFDGSNDTMTGSFTSSYAVPVTLGLFIKVTAHPLAVDYIMAFGNSNSANEDSLRIQTAVTDNVWKGFIEELLGTTGAVEITHSIDGVWAGLVVVYTSSTLRDIYIEAIGNTATNTASRTVSGALKHVRLGEPFAGAGDFTGLLAEVAIWDKALSTAEITSYLGGTQASTIAASDLIGYWPLSASNSTQSNLGVDAAGDLAVTGAIFSSDHPTISGSDTTVSPNAAGMSV